MDSKLSNHMPFTTHRVCGGKNIFSPVWQEIRRYGLSIELKKDTFFQPSDMSYFYCIESGELRCNFMTQNGKERSLLIYESGAFVNLEHALLNKPSNFSFFVAIDTKLWKIRSSLLTENISSFPHLACECLKLISAMSLTYQAALTFLEVDDFKSRFCRYLALNVRKFGDTSFRIGLTQSQCASTLGVHRATLARAIQSLKKDGIISTFTRERVEILDLEALLGLCGLP